MPFFDSASSSQDILQKYITADPDTPLTVTERFELERSLKQMMLRSDNVKWIVIYCEQRSDNYILFSDYAGLRQLSEDFPYLEELRSDSTKMEIYGTKPLAELNSNTFAICGGIPYYIGSGKILVGYSTAPFYNICNGTSFYLDSLSYRLTSNDSVVFEYHGPEALRTDDLSQAAGSKHLFTQNGKPIYSHSQSCGTKSSQLSYYASQQEIFFLCHVNTPLFIFLFFMFAAISFWGYAYILRMMRKEVSVIQDGLDQISENNLEYRIDNRFQQDELSEIAESINHMTERLKHNIHLAYYYEIKQREAELAELQSKFNPHFLYNTLEMLRARCQANGDEANADLIADMSTIFRGLISSKSFVPLNEELSFSRHYLSLLGARYGGSVQVRYNFDKELFSCGIIRNLFQPLIENYFVHGVDTSSTDNYILLSGKSLDDKTMLLAVEDNGIGMPPEDIARLNEKIREPIDINTESYGLKNLHQRLALFYGGNCGLTIYPNPNASKGLSVQITASKMTCAQYDAFRQERPKTTSI